LQNEETFLKYITKIFVPYKNATIKRLNLPVNQVSLLKLDLHYSHKTPAVLQLLKENNIEVVFVPARCTDEMQECDTVINKPFKSGIKAAFRDFLISTALRETRSCGLSN
jgi:hypothetical protein